MPWVALAFVLLFLVFCVLVILYGPSDEPEGLYLGGGFGSWGDKTLDAPHRHEHESLLSALAKTLDGGATSRSAYRWKATGQRGGRRVSVELGQGNPGPAGPGEAIVKAEVSARTNLRLTVARRDGGGFELLYAERTQQERATRLLIDPRFVEAASALFRELNARTLRVEFGRAQVTRPLPEGLRERDLLRVLEVLDQVAQACERLDEPPDRDDVKAQERRAVTRCPFCHEDFVDDAELETCQACHTAHHRECLDELQGKCTTLGCDGGGRGGLTIRVRAART